MSTAVANPVIEKQAFRNNSPGWLGVVKIGPKGDDRGASVAPGDIVWLSEAEQILTANAPRKAEDNPFIEQELAFGVDEEGAPVKQRVTPLTPVSENRYVPAGDRPIPATGMVVPPTEVVADDGTPPVVSAPVQPPQPGTDVTEPGGGDDEPDEAAIAAREAAVVAAARAGATPAPAVPGRAAAAEAAAAASTPPAPAPAPVGTLSGEDVSPPVVSPVASSQTSEDEETAAVVAPEEHAETGAAIQPSQEAVEGEFAATEEVGTPTAPAQAPTPYVPPQET